MTKLSSFMIVVALLFAMISCEKEMTNPGDFSIPSQLKIVQVSDTSGHTYPFEMLRTIDTTYVYSKIVKDTLKDASGKPVLDANNKYQISDKTVKYFGKTAKFHELKLIVLEATRTQLQIQLESNANWETLTQNGGTWFRTTTVGGGGDAMVKTSISQGLASARRAVPATHYIWSKDSTVMYKLTFNQKGRNEQ